MSVNKRQSQILTSARDVSIHYGGRMLRKLQSGLKVLSATAGSKFSHKIISLPSICSILHTHTLIGIYIIWVFFLKNVFSIDFFSIQT